jgi:uridine kinase
MSNEQGKKTLVIGITGGSGSGKTTFIEHVREAFSDQELCVVSQDNYYRPRDEQHTDEQGVRNFDLPESIDKKSLVADLEALITGHTIRRREYVFNNELAQPRILIFHPAPVIIVEGLFVLHFKKLRKLLDLKVYLHAKENLKIIRRIKRDRIERNYPLEDVLYRYEHHVLPTFEKYVKPYMEDADIVINNSGRFELGLEIFKGFLRSHLNGLARH